MGTGGGVAALLTPGYGLQSLRDKEQARGTIACGFRSFVAMAGEIGFSTLSPSPRGTGGEGSRNFIVGGAVQVRD
jgi:hypothetical protein